MRRSAGQLRDTETSYWRERQAAWRDEETGLHFAAGPFVLVRENSHLVIANMVTKEERVASSDDKRAAHVEMIKMADAWKAAHPYDPGTVYFVAADRLAAPVKIGFTMDLAKRLSSLQTGSAEPLKVLATVKGGRDLETAYHGKFAQFHVKGEWFYRSPEISKEIQRLSLAARDFPEAPSAVEDCRGLGERG